MGIRGLNVNLIYGLPRQTAARVLHSVEAAPMFRPARFALFGHTHVPWMKCHQRLIDGTSLPDLSERARQFEAASARAAAPERGVVASRRGPA